LQNEKKTADSQGRYKITGVEQFSSPIDPNQVAAVIAGGDPVWIAMSVNTDAWQSAHLQNDVIPDYTPNDDSGHALVLMGYRTVGNARQFLVHNSWGPRWGENG